MGRIPKSVKEKALAEHISATRENEDPTRASSPRIPPLSFPPGDALSTSSMADISLPLIDEHSLFADLDRVPIGNPLACQTPPPVNTSVRTSCYRYELPENFTIDETKSEENEHDHRIVKLSPTALTNYMTNCEERFATHVIERMRTIVNKISHPTACTELDYEESSFIRHLRWKMFDLSNTYNGRTRQLIERMNSMIHLRVGFLIERRHLILLVVRVLDRRLSGQVFVAAGHLGGPNRFVRLTDRCASSARCVPPRCHSISREKSHHFRPRRK